MKEKKGSYSEKATEEKTLEEIKEFNLGLYYGIASAFLVALWDQLKPRIWKVMAMVILSLNIYLIFIFAVRTVWVAGAVLGVYFLLLMRKRMAKMIICLVPVFFLVSSFLFVVDFAAVHQYKRISRAVGKAEGVIFFLERSMASFGGEKQGNDESALKGLTERRCDAADNIFWRKNIWGQTLSFASESPVFGKGFGVYPEYVVRGEYLRPPKVIGAGSKVTPPHNHLITVFLKMGFVGLGLFLFINGYALVYGFWAIKRSRDGFFKSFLAGAVGAFIYWHMMALSFDVIDSPPTSIFLWIIMGLIFAVVRLDKETGMCDTITRR